MRLTGGRSEDEPSGVLFLLADIWLADMVTAAAARGSGTYSGRSGSILSRSVSRATDALGGTARHGRTGQDVQGGGIMLWTQTRDTPAAPAGLKGARMRTAAAATASGEPKPDAGNREASSVGNARAGSASKKRHEQ